MFGLDALHSPLQLALILSTMVVALIPRVHENHGKAGAVIVMTAIGLNIVPADQYIALELPARLYRTQSASAA